MNGTRSIISIFKFTKIKRWISLLETKIFCNIYLEFTSHIFRQNKLGSLSLSTPTKSPPRV